MAVRTWSFYGPTIRTVWLLRITERECTTGFGLVWRGRPRPRNASITECHLRALSALSAAPEPRLPAAPSPLHIPPEPPPQTGSTRTSSPAHIRAAAFSPAMPDRPAPAATPSSFQKHSPDSPTPPRSPPPQESKTYLTSVPGSRAPWLQAAAAQNLHRATGRRTPWRHRKKSAALRSARTP